ncbi:MAG: hypothetical protein GY801_39600, partial [bacterium]|nr:hypothetical protein [bacterium]
MSVQGQEAIAATVGLALQSGDTLETLAGAAVGLILSEGSELTLGENTKVDISELSQPPGTKVRKSRLRLWAGKVRAFLSPGHQEKGSSFDVDTPNAIAGVKFSRPEIMVSYDPATETTVVEAYTVDMVLRNLITQEVMDVPKGNQGIIRRESTIVSPLPQRTPPKIDESPEEVPSEEPEETPEESPEEFLQESIEE